MGCMYHIKPTEELKDELNPERDHYLIHTFTSNSKLLISLKKIQSQFRGMLIRKKINKLINSKFLNNFPNESNSHYTIIQTDKITEEDIHQLFLKYPPLEDNIQVKLKNPVQYDNKAIYYGEWNNNNNSRHGRGIFLFDDSKYEGYWKNDRANIKGKLTHKNGDVYEGEWLDDKADGFGIYSHVDGAQYKGYWKNDKQNGKGCESWPEGAYYEGDYVNGKKNGHGIYKWNDGSYYDGEFSNNNIEGFGTYVWSDNRKYKGYWKENKMNGKGEFYYPDGRKYIGEYLNDKMNGKGLFIWPDGRKYEGDYVNNKKEGNGKFEWSDGRIYDGAWKNGKQDGEGNFYNNRQKKWKKGLWKEGKRIKWIDDFLIYMKDSEV